MDTLLNFSGGVDSTCCMWLYLSKEKKKKLLVHHITLNSTEKRAEYETTAVKNILLWFKKRGMNNFDYINTRIDYGNVPLYVLDAYPIGFFTGLILMQKRYQNIKYMIRPTILDERIRLGDALEKRRAKETALRTTLAGREVEILTPIAEMNKQEIIATMPKDLFKLCWYCRKPVNGKTCWERGLPRDKWCHTCGHVKGT